MYTFMPIVFLIVVTAIWLLHKVKNKVYCSMDILRNTTYFRCFISCDRKFKGNYGDCNWWRCCNKGRKVER